MKLLKTTYLNKGEFLLRQDNTCRNIFFLEKGLARGFYNLDGKEVTSWFAFENEMITSMASFIKQVPSNENIELLEDSVLHSISYESLQGLYQKYPAFNLIGRILTEQYYIELEERTLSLQFQAAKIRYQNLLSHQPQLLHRVSLKHVASYLGISQETLSRVRAKK